MVLTNPNINWLPCEARGSSSLKAQRVAQLINIQIRNYISIFNVKSMGLITLHYIIVIYHTRSVKSCHTDFVKGKDPGH